jgi:hypothetical protein
MALFARICVLRGFPAAVYKEVCLTENPCAALIQKKIAHL